MSATLDISLGLQLPIEFVTMTQAILARKRSGKSYTASVQAEGLLDAGQQVIVIDPTSAWYGLRSSADGKEPGYPIIVFGGDHGDAPLDYLSGVAMAEAAVNEGFSAIFDVGNMRTEEQLAFVANFASELLRINRNPVHVFMDEADTFAPQMPKTAAQHACLGTVSRLVKQGGIRGVGFTMITQRSASINKDILAQVDILTVLRMGLPADIKAATDWIKSEVSVEFANEVKAALPSLPIGTAFICSASLDIGKRVKIRQRRTFNSGATPKVGEVRIAPKFAHVDIERLGKKVAEFVQRSKEESPEFLKKRIADLEAKGRSVEVRDPNPDLIQRIDQLTADVEYWLDRHRYVRGGLKGITDDVAKIIAGDDDLENRRMERTPAVAMAREWSKAEEPASHGINGTPVGLSGLHTGVADTYSGLNRSQPNSSLDGPSQRIIAALVHFRRIGVLRPEKMHVCLFSGYSNITSKGFANAIGSLRTQGLVEYPEGGRVSITEAGLKEASGGMATQRPATTEALQELIFAMLSGPETSILKAALRMYPKSVPREAVMHLTGYTNATSKGFANSLGRLRSLGFIDYPTRGEVVATARCFVGGAQ